MRIYENIQFCINLNLITASLISCLNLKDGLLAVNSAIALFLCYFELVMHA